LLYNSLIYFKQRKLKTSKKAEISILFFCGHHLQKLTHSNANQRCAGALEQEYRSRLRQELAFFNRSRSRSDF